MSRTGSSKGVDNKTVPGWKGTIGWLATPQNHDYPAAKSYLRLLFDESSAARFVKATAQCEGHRIQGKGHLSRLRAFHARCEQFACQEG
jgi:hypothetical protein